MADNMTNDLYNQAKTAEKTVKEAKKIFYDLETDAAKSHGIGTHAVTFSAYSPETGKTYGGAGNEVLVNYGNDAQNIAYAQAAMNLRIDGTDQLVESAVQLRKLLLQTDDVIESYEKNKEKLQSGTKEYEAVVKAYNEKGKTITAILKDLKNPATFGFESPQKIQMVGYNNSDFDDNVMQQIAAAYQGAARNQVKRKTSNLFGKGKTVDLRQTVANVFEKRGLLNAQFSGVLKLQDLNKLITGAVSDAAHSADDDVVTTALLEAELKKPNNIIEKFAQAMEKGYQKRGLSNFNKQKGSDYRKLWEDVYNQIFEEAQLARQNRGSIDDISVEEIVKKLTINPVSSGGKQPTASPLSKSTSSFATLGKGGRSPKDVKSEMDKKLTEAQNFAKSVVSQTEKSGNKKAQNALNGTHIQQRGQMLGQDFQNLNKINATDYLAQIYEQADRWGIGVVAQVDGDQLKVGFYPKDQGFSGDWGDIANVSLGIVDDKGMIRSGSGTAANLMYTTLKWSDTSDGKRIASPALITSMEMQLKNIANLFGYNREDGNPTDFTKNILGGNIKTASSSMEFAGRKALSGAPTTQQNKNVEEAMSQIWGEKNPEQLATMLGMVSNSDLASTFYAQFKDWINEVYAQQHTAQGRKGDPQTIDPYNLTPEEESRFNVAYALISKLDDNQLYEEAQKLSGDKILQQILSGEDFGLLRKNIRSFAANGLTPNFEGIKEETFLANLFSILGSKDILPLNALGDFSNRSLSQSFNYQPRAKTNIAQLGKQGIFSSDVGRALGVDYNSLERSQYYGSTTNDEELLKAAQELSSVYTDLEGFMASVKEGGVIMSADMAKQLTSYKETYSKELGKKAVSSLQKRFGVDPDELSKLAIGETVKVSDNFQNITGQSILGGVKVKAGDQVLGFRKTVNGIQAIIKQIDKVKNGSKILTEGGERLTARVLPTEVFNAIANKLGKSGAQYLTEAHGMQSRKYMPELSGRFSYMVQEALTNNKSIEEVYEIMKEVAPTWANMLKLVNGKFESNFFLDDKTGTYKYFGADGKIAELLPDGENSARKAWIEDSEGSELSALGKKLLGEDTYNATRGLLSQAVNMAKDAAYFESSGYSNADTREQSRVKFASREREAFKRAVLGSQGAVKDKEGLATYVRVEDRIQNTYGKEGQKAQKTLENLKLFYENTPNRTQLKQRAGTEKIVTLKWGGADESRGEVDISQALADFDWENGSVSKDQYEKSAMALAREFIATHTGYDASAPVVLDLTGSRIAGNNTYSVLSDITPVETAEGGYIPSLTDKILSQIIRAVQTGDGKNVTAAFENATKSIKDITTSKDSELVKAATESKVPNASYLKAVGINTALANNSVKGGGTLQNTAFVTSNRLRSLLSSSKDGTKEERKAALVQNIKNLSWMYRAGAGEDKLVGKDGQVLDLTSDLTEAANGIKDLANIEKELVENIIAAVKSGQMDITGQIHRYPSTSGLDVHHTKIAIDDMNTSDDAVEIGRGMSIAMNADYDGDKTWLRAAMASGGYDNYEQYKKAYDAARNLREIEDRIANDLGDWEKRKDAEKTVGGENDEQLVKDLSNRNPNWYAALMSKSNKKYVGQFSNMASRVRGAMSKTGFDEMGGTAAGEAKLIRAFYEVFEQDSISAKKVFARLSKENGEDVAVDELTKLFDTLMRGNMEQIKNAIAQAQKMGIIGEMLDTRQFQNARFTIKETDPEMYKAMGLDKSEDIPVETLLSALSRFNDVMIKQGFGGIENASRSNWVLNNKAINPANVRIRRATAPTTDKENVQTKDKQRELAKVAEQATALANSFVSVRSEDIVVDNSNGKHSALLPGFSSDEIDSVTTLLKKAIPGRQDESQMSFKDREMLRVSSAKGTFMHGLMELIGKEANVGRTVNADDLVGTAEYQKLESDLQKELGLAANNEVVAQLRKRVDATAKIGRREGLIGENILQEVNLGGYFTDSTGGIGSRGIKGTADVISYQKDENGKIKNAKVGDWKFSQDSSPETFLERLLQANIYLGIEEKKVKDSIDKLEEIKKNNNGILTDEDEAKLQELTQQREALTNGEIEIVRNHNRDGQIVNETSLAKRLSSEDVFSLLQALQNGDIATATQFAGKAAGNVTSRKYYDESGNETFSQDVWNSVKAQTSQQISDLKEVGVAYKELINLEAEIASMKARGNSEDQEEIAYLQQILNSRKQELGIQEDQNLTKDTFLQALQERHKAIIENIQALEGLTEEQKRSLRDSATTEYNRQRRGVNKAFTAYDKVGAVNTKDFETLQKGWFSGQQTANRLKNDIAIAQAKSRGMSGQQAIQQANYIARLQQSLNDVQMNSPSLTKNQNGDYVLKSGEKEIVASKEQALNIQKQINELTREEANSQLRLGNNIQQNVGFLDRLKENFKMSFSQISNYIMGYASFQGIQNVIRQVTSATEQLDQKMVDLQIASGYTRDEINSLMYNFNRLGIEMGKTTQEMAEAANDWLRAGYEGAEVTQLTQSSMQLATLGMINSADATSYLISVLKGWKLEASEVNNIVDKLTAVDMAAAISAGDLAEAMSRANNSAQMAGTSLDKYIGYLTTITDVTQKSAATVGESLKSVYSRYQNVAAGKFVAAQSDIDSENYNAEDWSRLNDVEKALKALGINIRSSVDTFRNFDDVVAEIIDKWSSFSDVQKAGIATSLGGTRQRENLITLFENGNLIEKYEKISENAYGTAAKKMEAYSDSVEAAKTRISAAVEKFVIALNASDSLKKFYSEIADLAENFSTLVTATSIILAYINRGSIVTSLSAGVGKLVGTMGRMASYINNQQIANSVIGKGSGSFVANGWNLAMDNAQETYMASVRQSYQQGMSNFIDSMSKVSSNWKTLTKAYMLPLQNTIFGLTEAQREQWVSSINQVTLGQEEAIVAARKLVTERDSVMIQALLNGTTQEERNVILQQIAKERVANGQTDALTSAKKDYEIAVRKAASLVSSKEGQYLRGQLKGYNEVNPKQAIYEGTGQMIGSMLGVSVGTSLGKTLTDKLGLSNSAAQLAGTVGGLALGSIGGKAVGGMLAGARITSGGIAAIAALVVGGIASLYFSQENKRKEEAQKIAQEAVEKYTEAANASIDTSKYDELVKRVDSLGNNVSLTDEQYKEFLDTSNKLAESFPNLIVRTDEAGNSFLGLNGKVGTVTDSVNELVDSLQKEADFKLLDSDYFDQIVDEATSSRSDLEKQIKKKKDEARKYMNNASTFKEGGELRQQSLDKAQELFVEANNLQRQLDSMGSIGYSEYRDQVEAVIRRNSTLSESYENLTDEQKQYVDMIKQSMNFDGMSTGEVKARVTEVMSDAIKNAPEMENVFKTYFELDDNVSPDEFTKVRQNLLQGILNNAGFLTEDEKGQLLVKIGFTLVGDTWVDNENPLESIQRDFNVKSYTNDNQISIAKLKMLRTKDVKKVWGYLNNGDITANTSMDTIANMLYADRDAPTSIENLTKYVDNLSIRAMQAKNALNSLSFKDWKGLSQEDLTEKFSNLPEAWRNGIESLKQEIENGDIGEDELSDRLDSLYKTFASSISENSTNLARLALENAFSPSQLTDDVDGIIDKMSELQASLKAVAESYDLLSDAQQEQTKYGKLSLSTVVDLLTENLNYAKVLDFQVDSETGKTTAIKLSANAQQIMNQIQIDAIKTNLEQAIADNNVAIEERNKRIAFLKGADAQMDSVDSSEEGISVGNALGGVLTKIAKILARVTALFGALKAGEGLKNALDSANAAAAAVSDWEDLSWVKKVTLMTDQEREDEITRLEQENVDDKTENQIYRYTADNLTPDNINSELRRYAKNNDESKNSSLEDRLSALEGIYQKEYYLRKSYKDFGNINAGSEAAYMNKEYYSGLKQVYQLESQYYASKLPKGKKVSEYTKDELGYLQKYQECQIKINNLDDEEWEDRINILELQGASLEKLIEANKEYEKTSDSLQEHLERTQKINELLIQQLELHKEVSQWQRDNTDRLIDRLSGDAYGNSAYDQAIDQQVEAITDEMATTQNIIQKYYALAVKGYEDSGSTHAEALRLAYTGNNDYSEKLRSVMTDYYDLIDKRTEYTIKKLEDKADDLNRRMELLEKEKPDQWFKIGDIDSYYTQRMDLLQNQITLYEDALKDTSDMTDEQIQTIVDSLNEATLNLKQAQVDNLKDQTDLQSTQYDAIVYRINLWKDEIQDAIDAIEKAYEDEIKPIQDVSDELERQAKLEDLLAAKKAAAKEKERVALNALYKNGYISQKPEMVKTQERLKTIIFYSQRKEVKHGLYL